MGTWGAGLFDSDAALDGHGEVVDLLWRKASECVEQQWMVFSEGKENADWRVLEEGAIPYLYTLSLLAIKGQMLHIKLETFTQMQQRLMAMHDSLHKPLWKKASRARSYEVRLAAMLLSIRDGLADVLVPATKQAAAHLTARDEGK